MTKRLNRTKNSLNKIKLKIIQSNTKEDINNKKVEVKPIEYKNTAEIKIPKNISERIIGQNEGLGIIKKASKQRRNVLLIGEPGTGKSLLGQAVAEEISTTKLVDILCFPNEQDENNPLIRIMPKGKGRELVNKIKIQAMSSSRNMNFILFIVLIITLITPWWLRKEYGDIIAAASIIGSMIFFVAFLLFINLNKRLGNQKIKIPKLLVDNSEQKIAPFLDATGMKSGALLGDCLHDPLQTIFPDTIIYLIENDKIKPAQLSKLVDDLLNNNKEFIQKNYEGYAGMSIRSTKEIFVLGYQNGKVQPVRLLAVNRKEYNDEMIINKTEGKGNKIILTPEHKIFVDNEWIEARDVKPNSKFIELDRTIITEQEIINTFSEKERISAKNYKKYIKLKKEHPNFGYKKLAKILEIKAGQVRWWHCINSKPISIKTVTTLKKRGLLPLKSSNKNLDKISRILGSTFGDGGVFNNLNAIFLSSSELSSLKEYRKDMIDVFGSEIDKNFELRISGINKTGQCISNTNRAIVRYFLALGAPKGRKNKEIKIPEWVKSNEKTKKEFFGALLGNELCSPKFSIKHHYIDSLDFALCGNKSLKQNRLDLLEELRLYLTSYGIKCSPNIYENEFRTNSYSWRLCISKELENVIKFKQFILIRYSDSKIKRIEAALNEQFHWKKQKYKELLLKNKTINYITTTLRASERLLQIQNLEEIQLEKTRINFQGQIYNVTTGSGNLFANNILISNSGGLGTPAHERITPGAVHKANGGVLFIDEIGLLDYHSQQELLTALQEKKYKITGQSERSSGSMVATEPTPADFILIAAGNMETIEKMHPALRSRIRGYGYEVYMNETMEDNQENRNKLVQFVAQEVEKDKRIPHFTKEAVEEIVNEARKMAGTAGKLTVRLRELGGLIRAAGDFALESNAKFVEKTHVIKSKQFARPLEQQLADKYIESKKKYEIIITEGNRVGRVNGLAVIGRGAALSGLVLPIESEITPGGAKADIVATGQLGKIAKEAVKNVSAIILKSFGQDIKEKYDIYVQFLYTAGSGVEGDSASIAVATAIVSALEKIPVRQDTAMTGSLSIRGEVLPIGGATAKVEAAIEAGCKQVIIPKSNYEDLVLSKEQRNKIKVIPVSFFYEVLKNALVWKDKDKKLLKKLERADNSSNNSKI